MDSITIDNKSYDISDLDENGQAQLRSIRYVEEEITRLQANIAALSTAKLSYTRALIDSINKRHADTESNALGETISFE